MFRYIPSTRKVFAAALIAAAAAFTLHPAQAASKRDADACNKGTGDVRIAGCTRIIEGRGETARNRAIAYTKRGNVYYDKGDHDRAIADYTQAIRLDPKYAAAYSSRGNSNYAKGDHDRAIADYNEAIRINPKYASAYSNRGNAYSAKGDRNRAIADYSEAIRLNPKYADAYSNRGNEYRIKRDYDRAIADLSEAIRLDPKLAAAYYNRSLAWRAKKDKDRAAADLKKAAELGSPLARQALREGRTVSDTLITGRPVQGQPGKHESCQYIAHSASVALKNKEYEYARTRYTRAIEWMKRTCDATPDDLILFEHCKGRARASAHLGDHEQAAGDIATLMKGNFAAHLIDNDFDWMAQALDAAIKRQPDNASFYGVRADIHSARALDYRLDNKKDRAQASHKLALDDRNAQVKFARTKAEKAEALRDRHYTYQALNEPKLARADIDKAIGLDPKAGYYAARASFNKDQKDVGSMTQAISDISRAIELEPKRHWYHKMRAEIYEAAGDPASAAESLTQGLAVAPGGFYFDYLFKRAELFKNAGKSGEAGKDYAELVKKQPKNARWRSERMLFLLEQGQDDEAEAERKEIGKLDAKRLHGRGFVCHVSKIYARRYKAGNAASPENMRRAWNAGEIMSLVPLRHLVGKQDAKSEKAWAAVSNLVRGAQKDAGQQGPGLGAIPEFKGSKPEQLKQAIAFILAQFETVKSAVAHRYGEQAGEVFAVSAAGSLAHGLNQLGVASLNPRLGGLIAKHGPPSGVACGVWAETMLKTVSNAKAADVVAAWTEARKGFKEANAK